MPNSPSPSSPVAGNLNATGPSLRATLTYTVTQDPTRGMPCEPRRQLHLHPRTRPFEHRRDRQFSRSLSMMGVLTGCPAFEESSGRWPHSFAQAIGLSGPDTTTATITVSAVQPPSGFTATTLVSGLTEPTDMAFLPDGRMLITEKGGQVLVASSADQVQSTPLITLPTDSTFSRGLWGVAVDPNYDTNGYVYVTYTAADDTAGNSYERLSRITVADPTATVLTAATEDVLIPRRPAGHHGPFRRWAGFRPRR